MSTKISSPKTKRKTGSGPRIPEACRTMIYHAALEDSDKSRADLAAELPKILKKAGYRSPSHLTLMQMISYIRNARSPEDDPWHLGSLGKYPIPPEALPSVLAVAQYHIISIRDAKWISRLYATEGSTSTPDSAFSIAHSYAVYERIAESHKRRKPLSLPFDSQWLDNIMFQTMLSKGAMDHVPPEFQYPGPRPPSGTLEDSIQLPPDSPYLLEPPPNRRSEREL